MEGGANEAVGRRRKAEDGNRFPWGRGSSIEVGLSRSRKPPAPGNKLLPLPRGRQGGGVGLFLSLPLPLNAVDFRIPAGFSGGRKARPHPPAKVNSIAPAPPAVVRGAGLAAGWGCGSTSSFGNYSPCSTIQPIYLREGPMKLTYGPMARGSEDTPASFFPGRC